MPVVEWLAKMKEKMTVDNNLMETLWRCMAYVMSRVSSTAFGHLEPRARENEPRLWKNLNKMLAYLEWVFRDSNRRQNAEYKFWVLHQEGQDFNTFWAKLLQLSIKLDKNKATLISNLTHKLLLDVCVQLINGDKSTNLMAYAKRCQRVYQGLKEITHAEALERSVEECVEEVVAPVPRFRPTTIRTTRSSCYPVTSEKDQLMKEGRCFSCREVGHRTIDCPSEQKAIDKWKPRIKLAVSHMVVQEAKPKESHTKAL